MTTSNNSVRTCGKCGGTAPVGGAHNARTCGKSPAMPTAHTVPPTAGSGVVGEQRSGSPSSSFTRDGFVRWDNLLRNIATASETTPPSHNEPDRTNDNPTAHPAGETYTADELVALWELSHPTTPSLRNSTDLASFIHSIAQVVQPEVTADFFVRYLQKTRSGDDGGVSLVIEKSLIPPDHLKKLLLVLYESDVPGWKRVIARHPLLPPHLINELAVSANLGYRASVAENPATPPETLDMLSRDAHAWIRRCVAGNLATPGHVLATLVEDADEEVIVAVAENVSTPPEVLQRLAQPPRWYHFSLFRHITTTRMIAEFAALENPSCPTAVLTRAAKSRNYLYRLGAARNPSLPRALQQQLLRDTHPRIRRALLP